MTMPDLLALLEHLELSQQCSVLAIARTIREGPNALGLYDDEAAIEMAMRVCGHLPDTGWTGTMDAGAAEYEDIMRGKDLLK